MFTPITTANANYRNSPNGFESLIAVYLLVIRRQRDCIHFCNDYASSMVVKTFITERHFHNSEVKSPNWPKKCMSMIWNTNWVTSE